ncbi:MAG: EAL domain-containing protein [Acidimicrobiaceae bacterium]|nr:EAL domain-containing protein [Acidimicrobiaceae bacterium]
MNSDTSAPTMREMGLLTNLLDRAVLDLDPGVQASPLPTAVAGLTGKILLANASYCEAMGRSLEQLRDLTVDDITFADDVQIDSQARRALAKGQIQCHVIHKRYLRPDSTIISCWTKVSAVRGPDERPIALMAHVTKIDSLNSDTVESFDADQTFSILFSSNPQPMYIFDTETLSFLEVNDAAMIFYGYSYDEFRRMTLADIRPTEDIKIITEYLKTRPGTVRNTQGWRHKLASGRIVEVNVNAHEILWKEVRAILVSIEDVTERNMLERQLINQALTDSLCNLPNRILFLDRLGQSILQAPEGQAYSIIYVDLEDFSWVNQSLGHETGDAILRIVADRLVSRLPNNTSVARINGDEFAIFSPDVFLPSDAEGLARTVQQVISEAIRVDDGSELNLTASIGIATASTFTEPAELLRDAAIASNRAKDLGSEIVVHAQPTDRPWSLERLNSRQELRIAIETGQLEVFYQPILSLAGREVQGLEALVRWRHPERGLIPPDQFIGLAEQTGLIIPLGRYVLRQACLQGAIWANSETNSSPPHMAVNVSVAQLRDVNFTAMVHQCLSESGLDPELLYLEITESVLLEQGNAVSTKLEALSEIGVHISLDDFGTGYSSLAQLDRLPIDILKIDRSFVTGIRDSQQHEVIVSAVISLAHRLGLKVIAEGVETEAEATYLLDLGAELAQGYLFCRPLPAHEIEHKLVDLGFQRP